MAVRKKTPKAKTNKVSNLSRETVSIESLTILMTDREDVSDEDVRHAKLLIKERGQFAPVIINRNNQVRWNEAVYLAMLELKRKTVWVETRNIVDAKLLFLNPNNSKIHEDQNTSEIANSLRRFGQQSPVIYRADGMVLKGNGTYRAATEILGWKKVWAEQSNLETYEADAYGIADNKLSERSSWDWRNVAETLRAIEAAGADIDNLGFPQYELEPLLNAEWQIPELEDLETHTRDDEKKSSNTDDDNKQGSTDGRHIFVTIEQWKIIDKAMNKVRKTEKEPSMSDGRCLEMICADYI